MRLYELRGFRTFPELIAIGRMLDRDPYSGSDSLRRLQYAIESNDHKFRFLGKGASGLTFQPISRDYVIKIYIRDHGYDRAVQVMKANQSDPHMPKII